MVRRALRSHSFAQHKKRLPGNRTTVHYLRHKPHGAHCKYCGAELHGVPNDRVAKVRAVNHTSRRPERPYGGNLCPACLTQSIRNSIQK